MIITMTMSTFIADQLTVLDLLYEKFNIALVEKKKGQLDVAIFVDDLRRYNISTDRFGEIAYYFSQQKDNGLKLTKLFDEDEANVYWGGGDGTEPSCFELLLSSDFVKVYARLREEIQSQTANIPTPSLVTRGGKINFFPADGIAEYRTAQCTFMEGKKTRTLIAFLFGNKNTPFSLEDIKKFCNPDIRVEHHHFKSKKDINDTIREIRHRLKVRKGEYFPIYKVGNSKWIWVER